MKTKPEEKFVTDLGGRRVSCNTCGRAVIHQPYMNGEAFRKAVEKFKKTHKCGNWD
jgi:hypothetical protein